MIIGIWGGPNRVYAAIKFFLYTLMGSLLMLVALHLPVLRRPAAASMCLTGSKLQIPRQGAAR